jgi:hypothetical protein
VEDPDEEEENIHIISAREANKRERRIYLLQGQRVSRGNPFFDGSRRGRPPGTNPGSIILKSRR